MPDPRPSRACPSSLLHQRGRDESDGCVRLALHAMNTRFELLLHGEPEAALRAAGEEALREIARLEQMLSAFRPTSEISALNARASLEPVQVSPELFALLQRLQALHRLTRGTFDITLGPLMQCWGLWGTTEGRVPAQPELDEVRSRVGLQHLALQPGARTLRFQRPHMTLDLGGVGKGYALDCAAELLREQGVRSALLHGGTSSVLAIGHPPGQPSWPTALSVSKDHGRGTASPELRLELANESLSVSSVSTKAFVADGRVLGHVLDPRTGRPVEGALQSAVITSEATLAEVWSTALLVLGKEGLDVLAEALPGSRGLVVTGSREMPEVNIHGLHLV